MLYKAYNFKPGKVFPILVMLVFYTLTIFAQPDEMNTMNLHDELNKYTWHKRVLLLVTPSVADKKYIQQKAILENDKDGLEERDMEVIAKVVEEISQTDKAYLVKTFGIDSAQFHAILIGKDGSSKLKSVEPIPAEKLFETIDAMPMRREEMKKNKN